MEAPGILNLIGGILCLIFAALVGTAGTLLAFMPIIGLLAGAVVWGFAIWGIIVGLLLIISAMKETQKGWAIAGLIISILGLVTIQGFIIGPILGIIGSAMAMGRSKEAKKK